MQHNIRSDFASLIISILCVINPSTVKAQSNRYLDSLLNQFSILSGEAGIAVAVIKEDSLLYAGAAGYRDLHKRLPITVETVFPIGSCTKAFTAALAGCLTDKISLDAPVRKYLPELRFYNPEMTEQITLRDLLCHRTGLPRHDYSWYFMVANTRDSMLKRIEFLEPTERIAGKWQYNNFDYFLSGMLSERVYGNSYEEAIRHFLLEPLQMKRTYFSFDSLLHDKNAALGYKNINEKPRQVAYHPLTVMAPAGGLNSTVLDMSRWLSAWIGNNNIISPAFRSQAISSQIVAKPSLPNLDQPGTYFSNYGLGWYLSSYRGHYRVEHGGNIDGFTSTACFFPADSIGIIVLCNRDVSILPALVRNMLADHFLGLSFMDRLRDLNPVTKVKNKEHANYSSKATILPTHSLSSYTGSYEHPGYGRFSIYQNKDSLFAQFGNYTWWLVPQQYDSFRGIEITRDIKSDPDQPGMLLQFHSHVNGFIQSVSIPFEPTVSPITFKKQISSALVPDGSYAGRYQLAESIGEITLDAGGKISLILPAQKPHRLIPVEQDIFMLSGLKDVHLRFTRDQKNKISGFVLHQPKANFHATLIK